MGNEQLFSILDSPMMSFNFQNSEGEKDGYNWYAYVNNDPINYIDPLGLCSNTTVQSGDTLSQIAIDNGFDLQEIINMNPQIDNPDLIYPGQTVNLKYPQQDSWDMMTAWGKNYQEGQNIQESTFLDNLENSVFLEGLGTTIVGVAITGASGYAIYQSGGLAAEGLGSLFVTGVQITGLGIYEMTTGNDVDIIDLVFVPAEASIIGTVEGK